MGISNEEGLNRISLRVESALFEKLDRKRFEGKTTFQDVGVGLLKQWLGGDVEPSPGPEHEIITMMREYVELADPAELRALKAVLAGLLEHVRHRNKSRKRA